MIVVVVGKQELAVSDGREQWKHSGDARPDWNFSGLSGTPTCPLVTAVTDAPTCQLRCGE